MQSRGSKKTRKIMLNMEWEECKKRGGWQMKTTTTIGGDAKTHLLVDSFP